MKVVIVSPVMHDGAELVEGDTPDLPKNVAEALITAGAAIAQRAKRSDKKDDGAGGNAPEADAGADTGTGTDAGAGQE